MSPVVSVTVQDWPARPGHAHRLDSGQWRASFPGHICTASNCDRTPWPSNPFAYPGPHEEGAFRRDFATLAEAVDWLESTIAVRAEDSRKRWVTT